MDFKVIGIKSGFFEQNDNNLNVICPPTGADSLEYLSVEGLKRAVEFNMKSKNRGQSGHCTACLTGEYPGGLPEDLSW